jgi:chemotaxis signal transduction protein
LKLFLFRLGGERFALRGDQVRGVLPRGGASREAHRLRIPGASSDSAANLLVVACSGGVEALMEADRVEGLVELHEDALLGVPVFVFPEAAVTVSGVFEWDGGVVALLEPDGLDLLRLAPRTA